MQVVILAAGMGKRLRTKTKKHTKSMVEILGKTFLEHSLDKLTKFDISKIVIVIGYCGDEIKQVIGDTYNNIPVIYIENKDYETTNNIYSLALAKEYLKKEDTLLLESDLIYEETIIRNLLANDYPNLAVVDKYKPYMDGTVVKVNDKEEITAFVPKEHFDYKEINSYYKTVNIYKLSKEFLENEYVPFLDAYCEVMGKNAYYEQVMKVLLSLDKNDLRVLRLNGEKWYEVDDLQDYDIAEIIFCDDKKEKLNKLHSRYGGFWRFDKIKDFCYLVNPYFPPRRMLEEIKNSFETLLAQYPSSQNVDKILVSNIYGISEKHTLLGNGAAELINALMPEISGNVGIILPTFQEYPARLKNANIKYFVPKNPDFKYTIDDLKEYSKDIDSLVLVNPDNPSGNFIGKKDILSLLDLYKTQNKKLILDESFIDFANDFEENTLLKQEILLEYPNLILIKSISKSYGVPGLRLGILATTDEQLLKKVYKNLPVWNINSFGEFFLQILCKYTKAYKEACLQIGKNRQNLYEKLSELSFIRPVKSQANYILCEVLPPYTSGAIAEKMLDKNILLKDCKNKMGFDEKNYLRIAVKSQEDNTELIETLKGIK